MARGRHSIPVKTKMFILKRDRLTCQICGKRGQFVYRFGAPYAVENPKEIVFSKKYYNGSDVIPFEIDHIIPVALGGDNKPDNLWLLCRNCNRSKGIKIIGENNGK